MFYAFGGSKTLVKRTFLSWSWHEIYKNIDKHNLDAPNIDRHQKKNPATTQKWTHSSWKF